jgi:biotin transporter BioY
MISLGIDSIQFPSFLGGAFSGQLSAKAYLLIGFAENPVWAGLMADSVNPKFGVFGYTMVSFLH